MFAVITELRFFYFIVPYGPLCLRESECLFFLFKKLYMTISLTTSCVCIYKALSDEDINTLAHRMLLLAEEFVYIRATSLNK